MRPSISPQVGWRIEVTSGCFRLPKPFCPPHSLVRPIREAQRPAAVAAPLTLPSSAAKDIILADTGVARNGRPEPRRCRVAVLADAACLPIPAPLCGPVQCLHRSHSLCRPPAPLLPSAPTPLASPRTYLHTLSKAPLRWEPSPLSTSTSNIPRLLYSWAWMRCGGAGGWRECALFVAAPAMPSTAAVVLPARSFGWLAGNAQRQHDLWRLLGPPNTLPGDSVQL